MADGFEVVWKSEADPSDPKPYTDSPVYNLNMQNDRNAVIRFFTQTTTQQTTQLFGGQESLEKEEIIFGILSLTWIYLSLLPNNRLRGSLSRTVSARCIGWRCCDPFER
eukprot:scaffold41409_cov53-Attheya_sp.AAC.2